MSDPAAPQGEDPRVEDLRLTLAGRTINSLCDELETLRLENAKLRESNTLLNRRATRAEAIVAQRVEEQERKGKSLGRSLANAGYYALKAENEKLREALWACPACAFTFSAEHQDEGGGYSCPVCAQARLEAALLKIVHRPLAGDVADDANESRAIARAALDPSSTGTK